MTIQSIPSPASSMSSEEWELRVDLAACYRAFVHYGWTDLIFTHLSARLPDAPDQYLINPYGLLFQEITPGSLIKVDFDGNVIAGDYPFNDAGHAIHSAVLKARPDINVVLHSHTRAGMAVSCMAGGLLPLTQQANEIMDQVTYHEYDLATNNQEECDKLGRDLGDRYLMIMHNHGLLSVGRTVGEAFYFLYMLENACKVQVDVLASGTGHIIPGESARKHLLEESAIDPNGPFDAVTRSWAAVRRMIERANPELSSS